MSQENVEIVRRVLDLLTRADWESLAGLCDPDIEFCDLRNAVDTPQALHGRPAVGVLVTRWSEAWSAFGAELLGHMDVDPYVICNVRWHGTGRETGMPIDVHQVDVYELRGGKVVRVVLGYDNSTEALKAVGLEE